MANIADTVKELEQERSRLAGEVRKLDKAIAVLRKLGGSPFGAQKTAKKRRPMSAAARRKIGAAQRARWAKWKQKQGKKAA
jgi:hypothetical protein